MRWIVVLVLVGCGGGSTQHSDAAADGPADGPVDARADAADLCGGSSCDLTCDPADTWLALTRGPGTGLGDSDPATPTEVGDGMWHLFVGNNEQTGQLPDVYLYDATASAPDATFALPAQPLGRTRDTYDMLGSETPSYFRADAHTEYVYYCAIESYQPLSAHVAAYRRVDGGSWAKVGIVAPNASDELSVCEPNVVRDDGGTIVLRYLSVTSGNRIQERERTSSDPTSFAVSTSSTLLDSALTDVFPNRLAVAKDPYAGVWRTSYDMSSGNYAEMTLQTWSATPAIAAADLTHAQVLHDGRHATHVDLHTDFTGCDMTTCPQGAVLQPSKPIFPDASTVIFYYSGWSLETAGHLQVAGQRCRRGT